MSQEEESSGRVTRGALRRRSIDQDTSIGPGTPKKVAVAAKKGPALDAILETNGTSESSPATARSVNKTVQKLKELEPEKVSNRRSRTHSLTEENVEAHNAGTGEVRRTPRRRPSQDVPITPQTAPAATRRITRRNSIASDDGTASTPKVTTKARLNVSVAQPTIVEDDEKDTSSTSAVPEAELSDLDIRKLRNRSISNSPVPRGSPTGKNSSSVSLKPDDDEPATKPVTVVLQDVVKQPTPTTSPAKIVAPESADSSVAEMETLEVTAQKSNESVELTPSKVNTSQQLRKSVSGSAQKLQKSVTFDELATPERQNHSAYPRTPVPQSEEKSFKFDGKKEEEVKKEEKATSPPEVFEIDETVHDSPKKENAKTTPDLDQSLANIVEDVRENMAAAACDLSMSILGTPKPKKLLPHLREGSCSTPIAGGDAKVGSPKFVSNTPDGRGLKGKEASGEGEKMAKSWSQAVKGSAGKGIDVFSVRKQEEQERKEEETKKLNESLKRKSPKKTPRKVQEEDDEDDEEVGVSELLGGESSQESNFLDDEAEVADGDYESGDSLDSEERQEMEENEVPEMGETIGSEDSENEGSDDEEEGDDDSFIASEGEEPELLEGTGDDLEPDEEQDKSKKKKRKRIIQVVDTSDDEKEISKKELSTVSLDRTTTASENSTVEVKSPKKTPVKAPEQSPKKSPVKSADPTERTDVPKSRKSMPPPALISADFYSPAAKKTKRNTINVLAEETEEQPKEPTPAKKAEEKRKSSLLANPAALALAKKNKRMSLDQAAPAKSENKRASLPGKLPADKPLDKSLVKKTKTQDIPEEPEAVADESEPMEVDEEEEDGDDSDSDGVEVEQVVPQKKKKAKELSEFDTDAILSRCNEVVRADKERKKQSATLRQKKKDEKRRQREAGQAEGDWDDEEKEGAGEESGSPDKKKKKKKKKPINYLLEELGETREEQVARALQRKHALLEAKRERKKAKKAAKLQHQLNKENQDGENQAGGIGAKFEKKTKKKDKKSVVEQLVTEPAVQVPKVKLAVSAFQAYKEQIEDLQKEKPKGKKKTKQLKEKNQQQSPTAAEEVKAALQVEPVKTKKEKKAPRQEPVEVPAPEEGDKPKKKKKLEVPEPSEPKPKKCQKQAVLDEQAKLDAELAQLKQAISEPIAKPPQPVKQQKSLAEQRKLDADLAKLKQVLSDPAGKVVKKQKLSHAQAATVCAAPEVEATPPRKLKALARLETGFTEEPVTPEQQKMKRNHGFREEPVTPKPVGFKVSAVLPTGQQELAQRAALTKKQNRKPAHSGRVRPEDVQEPVRSLPLPIWTRSGTFEVEEFADNKKKPTKKTKSFDDGYIPVNGSEKGSATEFLVKPLGASKGAAAAASKKANRIDLATVDDAVINFKKQAIFGKTAHLREKKSKR